MNSQIRTRKKYSQEFKREAVSLVEDQGYSKAEAARSLGVRPELIRRWYREFIVQSTEAFAGNGHLSADQQRIQELEAENRRLKMEKDILKKATVFFVQENS